MESLPDPSPDPPRPRARHVYNRKVIAACEKAGAAFSVTTKMSPALHKVIEAIPDEDWEAIPYFLEGAGVAGPPTRPSPPTREPSSVG